METKKITILSEASEVYKKYGIKSVSMEDLSKELKISKKTLYSYFKNKEDLLEQLFLDFHNDAFTERVEQHKQYNYNAIDFIWHVAAKYFLEDSSLTTAIINDLNMHYPFLYAKFEDVAKSQKKDIIRDNILQGQAEGLYKSKIQIEILSFLFSSFDLFLKIPDNESFTDKDIFLELIKMYIYTVSSAAGIAYFESNYHT